MNLLEQANTLAQSGKSAEAIALYDQYLVLEPNNAAAWNNRGNALDDLGRREEALISYDKALALHPDYPHALCNKAVVLDFFYRHEEALACFDECIRIEPRFAVAHTNRGNTLQALRRFELAIMSHDRALALDPMFANAQWNQSLCRLLMSDYENGWQQYEWRWLAPAPSGQMLETPQSTWLGNASIAGKRIILWPEGGDGDVFQFVRFVPLVQAMGARVILAVRPSSISLMQSSFPQVELLPMHTGNAVPVCDEQTSLMSLPLACKIDAVTKLTSTAKPYLQANPAQSADWAQRLRALGQRKIRVGLTWSGDPRAGADSLRWLHFNDCRELLGVKPEQIHFFSLQKGPASSQAKSSSLIDFTDELHDWSDTAALIEHLDLVITCDTSVAHLSAAIGKPTWIVLRHNPCWRWLTDRSDSPWYPSVRLFRQTTFGDWETVIQEVAMALSTQLNQS